LNKILEATIRDTITGRKLAFVALNGYSAVLADPVAGERVIRSFQILSGDLRPQWRGHQTMLFCMKNGSALPVRVAALPAEEGGWGLVEFFLPSTAA
jgi:hypothetical protein